MEFETYFSFLLELCQALDSLSALEQKKIQAIQAGDLAALDECMKKEQVASLDLRGREQKRTALLKQLGLEKVPLRALPSHCPPQYKDRAAEITEKVLRSYQVLSSAQQAARTLMESNLRHIQKELAQREKTSAQRADSHKHTQTDFRA